MDPKKVEKKDGKVFEINKIEIIGSFFIIPNYTLDLYSNIRITPTGHLPIARLKPNNKKLPLFTLRWDQKDKTVDVDVDNVNNTIRKTFKNEKNGCSGHHSREGKIGKHSVFRFDIAYFSKRIFKGKLKVPVTRELEGNIIMKLKLASIVEFIPGKR